jgi:RHS repeat-associated protein
MDHAGLGQARCAEMPRIAASTSSPRDRLDRLVEWHRYYHAFIGRFVNRDPITYRGAFQLYEYVRSRPVVSVDPSGHVSWPERVWCVSHLICCCAAQNSPNLIRSEMRRRFPRIVGMDTTVVNAVQHCAWMCYVTSMWSCSKEEALLLGIAHEVGTPRNPEHNMAMDLYNNTVGADLGYNGQTLSSCFDKCQAKARAHILYWFGPVPGGGDPGQGLPTDFPGFTVDWWGRPTGDVGTSSTTPPQGVSEPVS